MSGSDGAGRERLAGQKWLEAAHAPVRLAFSVEERGHACDPVGLGHAADLVDAPKRSAE